jgi:curved DNA-binding protein CbpA
MIQGTDPYAVLGLTPLATQEQVRRAYRALLRQNHPDTRASGDAVEAAASTATLQEAIAAYAILGDPGRRTGYDRLARPRPTRARGLFRPAALFPLNGPDEPPIQAGPVRWHTSRR